MPAKRKPSPTRYSIDVEGNRFIVSEWTEDAGGLRCDFEFLHGGGAEWDVLGVARVIDGQVRMAELTVRPSMFVTSEDFEHSIRDRRPDEYPPAGVTSDVLRDVKVGKLLESLRRELAGVSVTELTDVERKWAAAAAEAVELKRGRDGYPDEHFRRIALSYLKLRNDGLTNGIAAALAEQEDRPAATVRDWIREAERRGFLTAASKGRGGTRTAGPSLTDETGDK
jgi:hypothetical protein